MINVVVERKIPLRHVMEFFNFIKPVDKTPYESLYLELR